MCSKAAFTTADTARDPPCAPRSRCGRSRSAAPLERKPRLQALPTPLLRLSSRGDSALEARLMLDHSAWRTAPSDRCGEVRGHSGPYTSPVMTLT